MVLHTERKMVWEVGGLLFTNGLSTITIRKDSKLFAITVTVRKDDTVNVFMKRRSRVQIVPPSMIENFLTQKVPESAFPQNIDGFKNYVLEMIDLAKKTDGIGLAAIQVGIPFHFFVAYDFDKRVWKVYFNAEYCPLSDSKGVSQTESCLSYPGKAFVVPRFDKVFMEWQEWNEKSEFVKKSGVFRDRTAQVLQHETDHCNGITIKMVGKAL